MPTKNPRVMAVLEPSQIEWLKSAAACRGISVSLLLKDIVREAQELAEDRHWSAVGEKRLKTFDRRKAKTSKDAWD